MCALDRSKVNLTWLITILMSLHQSILDENTKNLMESIDTRFEQIYSCSDELNCFELMDDRLRW